MKKDPQKKCHFSGIRDNLERGNVAEFLQEKITDGTKLSFISAYFTIYAFDELKEQLTQIDNLRFLFGEPAFIQQLDPDKQDKKSFDLEEAGLLLRGRLQQKSIAQACADWIRNKVQIKSIKQANLLHGKLYHIDDKGVKSAILGSSNFTTRGLGLHEKRNNIELNLIVDSHRDLQDLGAWFDELWNNEKLVIDVKERVLAYLEQLYVENSPEFIYCKTLYHLFEKFVTEQLNQPLLNEQALAETVIWQYLYEFQKDGVKSVIYKMNHYNGCILADSVGLGKTFIALAVIKYFELRNYRVLILCPKKLKENWTRYCANNNSPLNHFIKDRFTYTVLAHSDLTRTHGKSGDIDLAAIHWGGYDLVVIDESHNFRNDNQGTGQKSRYERLLQDIIQMGGKTQVLLLSATPVNNTLDDLYHQLRFITEDKDTAFINNLGIKSVKTTLKNAQKVFLNWAKNPSERGQVKHLLDKLDTSVFTLLDNLTIARSRKQIKRYYANSLQQLGGFPQRNPPHNEYPEIDTLQKFIKYDALFDEISSYKLSLFNPSSYIKAEHQVKYAGKVRNFSQLTREHYLIGMMRINFLKRLESSIHAFALTMERTVRKIEQLEHKLLQFKEINLTDLLDDLEEEELDETLQIGEKLKFNLADMDIERWLADLAEDKQKLTYLYQSAQQVTAARDAKLKVLQGLIVQKVQQPTLNQDARKNRKVLVFTAFADTAQYLYTHLEMFAKNLGIHSALVVGGTGKNKTTLGKSDFESILTNFSPMSKERAKTSSTVSEEIDLLIATDCISEGQNLQDCDYLINYDIHWNPVRIIQRFGRIDRIGSRNHRIQLVNFWATPHLDKYINLKNRVEARMALVDMTATFDENVLKAEEVESLVKNELKYRDQQLLRLREEVLDLEEFNDSITLTDFTLEDFRLELQNFLDSRREELKNAPLGMYAVVPATEKIPAGVIFCLRQLENTVKNEQINRLTPYFLVYLQDNGKIVYTFAHDKEILQVFRELCFGKTDVYKELCYLFNRETENGQQMAHYDDLLKAAVRSIVETFAKRHKMSLQFGRDAKLITENKQIQETTDFALITEKTMLRDNFLTFSKTDLLQASLQLFKTLGYVSERRIVDDAGLPATFLDNYDVAKRFSPERGLFAEWQTIHLLFQLTDEEIKPIKPAFGRDSKFCVSTDNSIIESFLFIALELKKSHYSRTQLAKITRAINQIFPMPAILLFKHGELLTLSVIRDESKDVLEKVTLIKDIRIEEPHRAQIDILEKLSLTALNVSNFVELHRKWQEVLDISVLNKQFYQELAVLFTQLVGGERGKTKHQTALKLPSISDDKVLKEFVVRLIGRLLFCWFLQKKTSNTGKS
ncbi:MAG: hypothetical protein BWK79_02270, partial [Beggiatoa sp. IS2]